MARYIDADALLKAMDERYKAKKGVVPNVLAEGFLQMEKLIKEQPTAEAKPVVHGCWEYHWFDSICSVCGYRNKADSVTRLRDDHNFCPNCGADMRKKVE